MASLTGFAFHAPTKMPALETLTVPAKPRVQTPEEMKAVFAAMRRA